VSGRGPAGRVVDFAIEQRHRVLREGRRVLEVPEDWTGGALAGTGERYDAAWVAPRDPGAVDLRALGRQLSDALAPGAPVVCVVPGRRPLPRTLRRALRAEGGAKPGPDVPSLGEWRDALGRSFAWGRTRALGVLVPSAGGGEWTEDSPGAFALLAILEHVIGTWPVLRGLGEHAILEGVRR
jgi:hypothetical protein